MIWGEIIKYALLILVPLILGIVVWNGFLYLQIEKYLRKQKYTMLELNIPKDVFKSPQAMEFVIDILHHLGGGAMDWKQRVWFGAVLQKSSLEIVSVEGNIYFFIRCPNKLGPLVKSSLYSQFPNAEINEVEDYTKYVPNYNHNQHLWDIYGADFKLTKDDYLPIKTYVDYELDKNVGSLDEEQKIDPITPMLEFLGTLRKGEQIWIQFIIRADPFTNWRSEAKAKIKDIMGKGKPIADDEPFQTVKLSHGEQEQIKAIERSLSKNAFETNIRALYIAEKENYNKGVVGFFKGPIFKPFSSQHLNGIKKNKDVGFDWVWQDMTGGRLPRHKKKFFNDYVNRSAFYAPFLAHLNPFWKGNDRNMILTSEELATLFHIPGRVAETQSLERIEATKAEAPSNLPL